MIQTPHELKVFLLAMLPVMELRGAIPLALKWGIDPQSAFLLAFGGNLVPAAGLLLGLEILVERLRRKEIFDRLISKIFHHTRRRGKVVEKYGPLGLALFVAVPLPVTGAWTGSILAYLLGIPFRRAFPSIAAGVGAAGILVTLASLGAIRLFG